MKTKHFKVQVEQDGDLFIASATTMRGKIGTNVYGETEQMAVITALYGLAESMQYFEESKKRK